MPWRALLPLEPSFQNEVSASAHLHTQPRLDDNTLVPVHVMAQEDQVAGISLHSKAEGWKAKRACAGCWAPPRHRDAHRAAHGAPPVEKSHDIASAYAMQAEVRDLQVEVATQ